MGIHERVRKRTCHPLSYVDRAYSEKIKSQNTSRPWLPLRLWLQATAVVADRPQGLIVYALAIIAIVYLDNP